MTTATALNIVAATIGFCAAVFFCIGNVLNTSKKIIVQASPIWDFSEPVALALAAQRAQYVAGALLLVISFLLQISANLTSSSTPANLPLYVHTWPCLVIAALVPASLLGGAVVAILYKKTKHKVSLHIEKLRLVSESSSNPPK